VQRILARCDVAVTVETAEFRYLCCDACAIGTIVREKARSTGDRRRDRSPCRTLRIGPQFHVDHQRSASRVRRRRVSHLHFRKVAKLLPSGPSPLPRASLQCLYHQGVVVVPLRPHSNLCE